MNMVFNFSPGPSMLPKDVLQQVQEELLDWHGIGKSIIEVSHRSKEFTDITEEAEINLRELLNVPLNYKILFCHGGARGQFSAIPLNLIGQIKKADYVETGHWSANAEKEAKKYCITNRINAITISNGKMGVKPMKDWKLSRNSAYVHYCPNETIDGIAIYEMPNFGHEKVVAADFSSSILSSPIDISQFGVIYASAQKNIGPSGISLVIIREDLLGKASEVCPSILNYTTLSNNKSMFNTPTTFSWYVAGLVFKWLKTNGGIKSINLINKKKADLIYNVIDSTNFYSHGINVIKSNRSIMNIRFNLINNTLEELFIKKSFFAGLHSLRGHRSVGGIRASIYNAMPIEGVKALTEFMIDFEKRYG